jgi:hypothetical protein
MANLLLPFAVGARVVYLETLNTTDLLNALAERRITIFACVPQFFYLIHQKVIFPLLSHSFVAGEGSSSPVFFTRLNHAQRQALQAFTCGTSVRRRLRPL